MRIASLCRRKVVTIDAGGTLAEAAQMMREHHVGALVVTTSTHEGSRVSGVVTDRDLVLEVLALGFDGGGTRIGNLAQSRIASVAEDDDVERAIEVMKHSGVRRLLVANAEQQLTGIVTFDDLMHEVAGLVSGLAEVIRSGIEREVAATAALPPAPAPMPRIPAVGTAGWGLQP